MVNLPASLLAICLFTTSALAVPTTTTQPYTPQLAPRLTIFEKVIKNCMANTVYVYQCVPKGSSPKKTHLPMLLTQSSNGKKCNGGDGAVWADLGGTPYENRPSNMQNEGCKAGQERFDSAVDWWRWRKDCGSFEKFARGVIKNEKSLHWWYTYEGDKSVKCTSDKDRH